MLTLRNVFEERHARHGRDSGTQRGGVPTEIAVLSNYAAGQIDYLRVPARWKRLGPIVRRS
jgi:hypothetical protein